MGKDMVHAAASAVEKNRYVVSAAVISAVLLAFLFAGCESTTASPIDPSRKVTRGELAIDVANRAAEFEARRAKLRSEIAALDAEVTAFNKASAQAVAALDRQDAARLAALKFVSVSLTQAAQGTFNPAGLIPFGVGIAGSLLGLGAVADNRRKDAVIKTMKKKSTEA